MSESKMEIKTTVPYEYPDPEGSINDDAVFIYKGYKMKKCQWMKTNNGVISIVAWNYLPLPESEVIEELIMSKDQGTGTALVVRQKTPSSIDFSPVEPVFAESKFISDHKSSINDDAVLFYKEYKMKKCQWMKTKYGIISIATSDHLPLISSDIIGEILLSKEQGSGIALVIKLKDNCLVDVNPVEPILN